MSAPPLAVLPTRRRPAGLAYRRRSAACLALLLALLPGRPARAGTIEDARKAMAKALASDDPAVRKTAFLAMMDHDGKDAFEDVAAVLGREQDPVVQHAAVLALGRMRSPAATDALAAATRAAKGPKRLLFLLAYREQMSDAGKAVLLEVAGGSDPVAAAHAGLALGRKKVAEAAPLLVALLAQKEPPVRAAAARALGELGALAPKDTAAKLADALATADGRDRTDLAVALETLTGQKGVDDDPAAWKALVGGAAAATVAKAPRPTAWVVGVPVRGKRVVLVVDHSVSTDDPHPFQDRERLQALCKVPGARDVPWFKMKTVGDFLNAHATRMVADLPEGRALGFVATGGTKNDTKLARPTPATPGARLAVTKAIEAMKPENGLDLLGALTAALDAGGKEPAALANGPDEIVYLGCGVPWQAPVKDPSAVGASAGLRARLRLVPIHMIGVGNHNADMYRTIADLSGGKYVDLSR
ncbi:MAG: HEAT repeat domain-containing protein [Planctomycetota bacterium]